MKKVMLIVSLMLITLGNVMAMPTSKGKERHLVLLHTSDMHGRVFSYDYLLGKSIDGALSEVAAYVDSVRTQNPHSVILTDGGDALQGQPTTYYYNFIDTHSPHLVASAMNRMHYDVGCMGNHDIETGHAVYDRFIQQCHFPILAANIIDTATNQPYCKPYAVFVRNGVKVAVLGMTTPCIPYMFPENLWSGLRFEPIDECARKWLRIIKEKEHPDVMVGVFHSGWDGGIVTPSCQENATKQVAETVPGFDVILYGHDHAQNVQEVVSADGSKTLCVGTTNNGICLGQVDISLSYQGGKIVSKSITGILPTMHTSKASAKFENGWSKERKAIEKFVNGAVCQLETPLRERDTFFGPAPLTTLIGDFELTSANADIALVTPLQFDITIDAGALTMRDMFKMYKYENYLFAMRFKGSEIKNVLEMSYDLWTNTMHSPDDHILNIDESLRNSRTNGLACRPYLCVSAVGIRYTVDVTKTKGQRVEIQSMENGEPFDADKEYTLACSSFIGSGGGDLLTKGAGISPDALQQRIVYRSNNDLRYLLLKKLQQQDVLRVEVDENWRFIPETFVVPAISRDRQYLFGE